MMRKKFLKAAGAALAFISLALSLVGPAEAARACASGYHADRQGHCQPNIPQTNRYCAKGYVYQPAPDGWRCLPPGY